MKTLNLMRKLAGIQEHSPKKAGKPLTESEQARELDANVADYEKLLAISREEQAKKEDETIERFRRLSGLTGDAKPYVSETYRGATVSPFPEGAEQPLAENAARFWELAGLTEGPAVSYDKGWSSSEEGTKPTVKGKGEGWKKVLAKNQPKPGKGQKFSREGGQDESYSALEQALLAHELPTRAGKDRKVDPKEFQYEGRHLDADGDTSWAHFKHRGTRNHVHLNLNDQHLVIPQSRSPFLRGEFDRVEHSEVTMRMRTLCGIE